VTATHGTFGIEDGQNVALETYGGIGITHLFVLTRLHSPNTHNGEGCYERKLFDVHGLD
jgi:hypothetical protein